MGASRITFAMIVLNGEPFVRYNLRALYPHAHQIVVVEGAAPNATAVATEDGHSTDDTLAAVRNFIAQEDPDNKVQLITAEDEGHQNGYWPGEKDQQAAACFSRATGNWVWQIDVDEFYHPDAMRRVIAMLDDNPTISGASFRWQNFWGGFDYLVDGWTFREIENQTDGARRLFRWGEGYQLTTHRPPTVCDADGRDLCDGNWLGGRRLASRGIWCHHYGMVLPKQAQQKAAYYQKMWANHGDMDQWLAETFETLASPYRILHGTPPPSWLTRFKGNHPPQIAGLIDDLARSANDMQRRPTDDIEQLLGSTRYRLMTAMLDHAYPLRGIANWLPRPARRAVKAALSH